MTPVRLGCVQYLNTLPLVEGLAACRDLELVAAVPSRLIDMLLAREIDLGLVSLIDAARSAEPLALLPVGMIGSDGPTLTVRLFSSVPIERIHTVCADTDSHTSVALLQVVLWKKWGARPRVIDFDARERVAVSPSHRLTVSGPDWPESILLIGDKVVTDPPPAERYPYQLDLGQAWRELTGLPFVYAVWMCRAADADSVTVRTGAAVLDRQRRHNATRLDWVVGARAGERSWPREQAQRYIGDLMRYEVTDREREAAERFLSEAAALGLAPATTLQWAEDAAATDTQS